MEVKLISNLKQRFFRTYNQILLKTAVNTVLNEISTNILFGTQRVQVHSINLTVRVNK